MKELIFIKTSKEEFKVCNKLSRYFHGSLNKRHERMLTAVAKRKKVCWCGDRGGICPVGNYAGDETVVVDNLIVKAYRAGKKKK
jgi:hypothetical protein